LDQHFWIDALALVAPTEKDGRSAFALRSARRLHACVRLDARGRHRLVRVLLRRLWPLEWARGGDASREYRTASRIPPPTLTRLASTSRAPRRLRHQRVSHRWMR